MLIDDINKKPSAGILQIDESNASILSVVNFVEKHLPEFSEKYSFSKIKNEPGLTEKLIILLTHKSNKENCLFFFHNEYMENPENGNSPRIDIGTITYQDNITIGTQTYSNEESFFSLEAKILGVSGKKREKEYLIGRFEKEKYLDTGAVERIKKGIHAGRLDYSAIIGYVIKHDFNDWHKTINLWVDDLIKNNKTTDITWDNADKLKKEYINKNLAKFISKNSRNKKPLINLWHLWIYIKN